MAKRVKGMGGGNERVNDSTALRVFTVHTQIFQNCGIVQLKVGGGRTEPFRFLTIFEHDTLFKSCQAISACHFP